MAWSALERDGRLGDALVDSYVEWREECLAVQSAFERWQRASRNEGAAAFASYTAALDREERASDTYAAIVRQFAPASQPW